MASTLSLDNVISALFWSVSKWTPEFRRNAGQELLRHLVCKLWGAGSGDLFSARIQASQEALAQSVGVSREWVCKLLARLEGAGWIESYAPRLPDGRFLPCLFKAGGQLKRLLYILMRYRRPRRSRVNDSSPSSPTKANIQKSYTFWQELKKTLAAKLERKEVR